MKNKYIVFEDRSFFEIKGEDKDTFLQGLITNDINKCTDKKSIYSAFLSPQGKFLADFFILKYENSYLFETPKLFLEELLKKLNNYKLRSKIDIVEKQSLISLSILGSDEIFGKLDSLGSTIKIDDGYAFIDPRNKELGIKVIINKDTINFFAKKYDLIEEDINKYEEIRINNAIPNSIFDLKYNNSLILENNFDKINAISWDKGCYVGQEITARIKYRSLLKKNLLKVKILNGFVNSGDDIYFEEKLIGTITSNNKNIALAMIRLSDFDNAIKKKAILESKNAKLKL
ncbi:MAG: tRNA-modifying protein YgfZ [Alphaproteobacteria bacterium MarineAlpha5_Bin12]|nr:MAG: tRNA-modifying protein YgfZ [Alphaproteobacteria bacterium MarineAlpha5_Bin12]|tara:strand:+ start:6259 stop:7122 length:864 start_codon:yes stop_codon:yes gene_type:complete